MWTSSWEQLGFGVCLAGGFHFLVVARFFMILVAETRRRFFWGRKSHVGILLARLWCVSDWCCLG